MVRRVLPARRKTYEAFRWRARVVCKGMKQRTKAVRGGHSAAPFGTFSAVLLPPWRYLVVITMAPWAWPVP